MWINLIGGLVILTLGVINVVRSRRQPPLINADKLKNLGFVGIGVGALLVAVATYKMLASPG